MRATPAAETFGNGAPAPMVRTASARRVATLAQLPERGRL